MMKTFTRKAIALATAFALSASLTGPASAATAIDSMLQGMYTAAGNPQFVQTTKMNTFSAGYVAVRTNINSFNVFAVVPPNFSAGCGGMDMYFGSFSFINSQQLEALIKAIGQDAIPFLFMDAIQSMCHSCYDDLVTLQNWLQKMNLGSLNACQIDRGIFTSNNSPITLASAANNLFSGLSTAAGQVSDWFQGLFGSGNPESSSSPEKNASATTQAAATASGGTAQGAANATTVSFDGNNTWKGIVSNNVVAYLNPGNPNDPVSAEILMSLIGTTVVSLGAGTGTPVASASAAGNSSSSTGPGMSNVSGQAQATLTLQDLVKGNPNSPILTCQPATIGSQTFPATGSSGALDPQACRTVTSNPGNTLGSSTYIGVDAMVNCAIFGTSGLASQNCPSGSGPGIVAEVQSGNPAVNWTPLEKSIYAESPIPFVTLMMRVGNNPTLQTVIASYALPYVQAYAAANLGLQLRNAMQQTFQNGGKQTYVYPPNYSQVMNTLNNSIEYYASQDRDVVNQSNQLEKFVESYLRSLQPYIPGVQ